MENRSATPTHQNNFNFLRLLFASLVLVSHAPELRTGDFSREQLHLLFGTITFGGFSTAGFFLLSGYLIVGSWQKSPDLLDYFKKRIRRIYPAFLVAFGICVVVVGPLAVTDVWAYKYQVNYLDLVRQALLLQPPIVSPDVFPGRPYPHLNAATWTISVEFRCYCLVALLGLLGLRWQRFLWPVLLLSSLLLGQIPERTRTITFPGSDIVTGNVEYLIHFIGFFAAGACFYLFRDKIQLRGPWAIGATVILIGCLFVPGLHWPALATLGAYCLFTVAFADIKLLAPFRRMEMDLSYGLYLYGWPVQKLLDYYLPTVSPWVLLPIAWVSAAFLGWVSWHLIEKRAMGHKRKHPPLAERVPVT